MRLRRDLQGTVLAVTLVLLGGCAGPGSGDGVQVPVAASAPSAPEAAPGPAERVAEALLSAALAERAQDGETLARATLQLERLGATPQTEADSAVMLRWRASLPADSQPLRGRALGPAYRSAMLDAGASTQLNQTFLGGRSAQIVLKVARGPAPRLVVRDQSDRQVCKADDDPVKCRWVPIYTQRHSIEIVNNGPGVSEFYIVFD